MTFPHGVWGVGPSGSYEALADRFRPLFARIREGAAKREVTRTLPFEEIGLLREAGFTALRVPQRFGGAGVTLPEFFALLTELAAADSNLPQALRSHFAFIEDVVNAPESPQRDAWLTRLGGGELVGGAWTEIGNAVVGTFDTRVTRNGSGLVLTGKKYYTTGSLYADWIEVGAIDDAGESVMVRVPRSAAGIDIADDWDGFGQILTASGTAVFDKVPVADEDVIGDGNRFRYSAAFFQTVHLATLAGIARAAASDVAAAVAERRRTFSHAAAPVAAQDPQILQVVGKVHSHAYAAGAIVEKATAALERAALAHGAGDEAAEEAANIAAEIEVAQAQTVVTSLVLEATTVLFDALGASATSRPKALDRYWRNARTLSSHNPRIYKDRIVGDYAVNGTLPPFQWTIGATPT
ncbi:acyl-CoA dehydrogenase family protein [Segnochrobactrum spirostomi]|uniref:Monooxygenase n=1 Tax=Segnochrobactrum spirostomi TaxID=2608987 RepID=A0A6A7Y755_9HYPH|nr:acyl-CoA dehydrogenase family protein [Segnochrobactrum spirostomi]MQT14656.1 monooxygenase [Segnochrobactrum spirostomi]